MNDYLVRLGYGSDELLIEFAPEAANQEFFGLLLDSLSELGTRVCDVQDLWMNDEVLLKCECDHGGFMISKDIWNLVFIMAPDNQGVIDIIDEALGRSVHFQKKPVNREDDC